MRAVHRRTGAAAAVVAALALTACSDDEPTATLDACSLVGDGVVEQAIGTAEFEASDESTGADDPRTANLVCRWTPESEGPALVVRAVQETSTGRAERDVAATEQSCDQAQPVEVTGVTGFICSTGDLAGGPQAYVTWDGFEVRAALTESRTPDGPVPSAGLEAVVAELKSNLSTESFTAAS